MYLVFVMSTYSFFANELQAKPRHCLQGETTSIPSTKMKMHLTNKLNYIIIV